MPRSNNNNNGHHSMADCLADLGLDDPALWAACESAVDEFKLLKQTYFAKVLVEHPDKGGDPESFRRTQVAFEILREAYQSDRLPEEGFASYLVVAQKKKAAGKKDTNGGDDWAAAPNWEEMYRHFESTEVPSYDFYEAAASTTVPGYRVELAKSGRSQCAKCKEKKKREQKKAAKAAAAAAAAAVEQEAGQAPAGATSATAIVLDAGPTAAAATTTLVPSVDPAFIPKGHLRIGSLDDQTGGYGRWNHLSCWRVPSKIWSGLTDPTSDDAVRTDLLGMEEVLLTGVSELDDDHVAALVEHVMDRSHWARKVKSRAKKAAVATFPSSPPMAAAGNKRPGSSDSPPTQGKRPKTEDADGGTGITSTTTLARKRFIIPRPGMNGAVDATYLQDQRFVLSGGFPEVGGGIGFTLGHAKVRSMLEAFGGRVTGSVSGKTDFVVIGHEPGQVLVSDAHGRGVPVVDLRTVEQLLMGQLSADTRVEQQRVTADVVSSQVSAVKDIRSLRRCLALQLVIFAIQPEGGRLRLPWQEEFFDAPRCHAAHPV